MFPATDQDFEFKGTLPFIATDLLQIYNRPAHNLSHDIESVFLVLLWTCLNYSGLDDEDPWMTDTLRGLNSSNPGRVCDAKFFILIKPHRIVVQGRYSHATHFLRAYAELCHQKTATYEAVNELFNKFREGGLRLCGDPAPSALVFTTSRSKRDRDADDATASVKRPRNSGSVPSSIPC